MESAREAEANKFEEGSGSDDDGLLKTPAEYRLEIEQLNAAMAMALRDSC